MKEISSWEQELQDIKYAKSDDRKKRLRQLAKRLGASTRAVGCGKDGRPFGYDASVAELSRFR